MDVNGTRYRLLGEEAVSCLSSHRMTALVIGRPGEYDQLISTLIATKFTCQAWHRKGRSVLSRSSERGTSNCICIVIVAECIWPGTEVDIKDVTWRVQRGPHLEKLSFCFNMFNG